MNDFEPTQTLEDRENDLWHQTSDNRWSTTGQDDDETSLTFNELDQQWGPLTAR